MGGMSGDFLKTSGFDFDLPEKFIAQNPASPRDSCKLLVYDTKNDRIYHKRFYEIVDFLMAGDVLVLNKSKVIPARILFNFGGKMREIFLLKKTGEISYHCLVRPGRIFKPGVKITVDKELFCEVEKILEDGSRIINFYFQGGDINLDQKLKSLGSIPLPPYIKHSISDFEDYQTVYAKDEGSIAAPTAGLHFTNQLLRKIAAIPVDIEKVILHVGLGTFSPISTENVKDHLMHAEEFELSDKTAENLNFAIKQKKRIVAVGTTSVRVLESSYDSKYGFSGGKGETDIFIYPGNYKWKIVDVLISNFHLPKSTLIMLVASFLESKGVKQPTKRILELYEIAKKNEYRFFSFGDAMMII